MLDHVFIIISLSYQNVFMFFHNAEFGSVTQPDKISYFSLIIFLNLHYLSYIWKAVPCPFPFLVLNCDPRHISHLKIYFKISIQWLTVVGNLNFLMPG